MTTRTATRKTKTVTHRRGKREKIEANAEIPAADSALIDAEIPAAETPTAADFAEDMAVETPPQAGQAVRSTKRAQLIALLQQPDGVTLAELAARLGWLPHTTRAALTGLRQSGHMIERRLDAEGASVYSLVGEA